MQRGIMDVTAIKPVVAAPASTQGTGTHPVISDPARIPPPEQPVAPVPPVNKLLHTQKVIAEQVSRYLQSSTRSLEFQVDNESGTAVIVVRDVEGQIIRRIPGEEVMQIMHRLNAQSGTLIDSTA
jgi:hypothetical protein